MLWTTRTEQDPAHQWLRHRIEAFARELEPSRPISLQPSAA